MSMHAGEQPIDAALVGRLLAAQFPHYAHLPLARVASSGTDHAIGLFELAAITIYYENLSGFAT